MKAHARHFDPKAIGEAGRKYPGRLNLITYAPRLLLNALPQVLHLMTTINTSITPILSVSSVRLSFQREGNIYHVPVHNAKPHKLPLYFPWQLPAPPLHSGGYIETESHLGRRARC